MHSQLVSGQDYPPDVNPEKREEYLSDEEFEKVMGMNKEEWTKIPTWKQENLKKTAKLF